MTSNVNVPGFFKLSVGKFATEIEILFLVGDVSQKKVRLVSRIMLSVK